MSKTQMVSVTRGEREPQVMSRLYVERFNLNRKKEDQYVMDEKATKEYYNTKYGKIQAASELQQSVNSDPSKKAIKSVQDAAKQIKNKK